jgi:hypothetical protein
MRSADGDIRRCGRVREDPGSAPRLRRREGARPATAAALLAVATLGMAWALPARDACAQEGASALHAPTLVFDAPASLDAYRLRLERIDRTRLVAVMRLVGLDTPGPPIRILLAGSASSLAGGVPDWVAGYALDAETVVLFPQRTPSYPHGSMEELLQHEIAHVLVARAAGGRRVPRWFHEGVALAAERTWSLGAQSQFAYHVAFGGAASPATIDALFGAGPEGVARAYALSGAFVQDLLETHGPDLPARVLRALPEQGTFNRAFLAVTRRTVDEANDDFWQKRRVWVSWLPWVTSPGTLYGLMTLLALAAILRVRARRVARRHAEDADAAVTRPSSDGDWPPDPPVTIH